MNYDPPEEVRRGAGKVRLSMKSRLEAVTAAARDYEKAESKKDRGRILDNLVGVTKYNRDYASHLLALHSRKTVIKDPDGKERRIVVAPKVKTVKRRRKRSYDQDVLAPLRRIWHVMDLPCGKRLAPCMEWLIPKLEECGELSVTPEVREKLLSVSASTIDRLLKSERKTFMLKGRSQTKPGTLLKHQIPIRTFSQWDDLRPGFTEMDLVDHGGGSTEGEYLFTLDVTDVATGWTELRAVKNKAQRWVFQALNLIRGRLPFPLLGIDSDNDTAFINAELARFCLANQITFTRSRAGKKNDNCYVEQKNWSVVRRVAGYSRFETGDELEILNQLYDALRLYQNFFQPSFKLVSKERTGAKVTKHYDSAKTPYERVLASDKVEQAAKDQLKEVFKGLNPVTLKRKITVFQQALSRIHAEHGQLVKRAVAPEESASFTLNLT